MTHKQALTYYDALHPRVQSEIDTNVLALRAGARAQSVAMTDVVAFDAIVNLAAYLSRQRLQVGTTA